MAEQKRPRGRPAMDCVTVNEKTFQRKKPATIKKAQVKKCESRATHPHKPCKLDAANKCVSATKCALACNSIRVNKAIKGKAEQKKDLRVRCGAMAKATGKKCTVPNTKRLVCHDAAAKKKASTKEAKYVPGMYKY